MELVGVTLVHRHGARLPTKMIDCNLGWPGNASFWSLYKGHLTPVGAKQANKLGKEMRKRYRGFFKNIRAHELQTRVRCNSSNVQRTINTAWSFYLGMFPHSRLHLKYMTDRPVNLYKKTEELLNLEGDTLGIRINMEEITSVDNLFHQNKSNKETKAWQKHNIRTSPFIIKCSQDSKYLDLCDKLYELTKLEKLSSQDPVDRILCLKLVYSDIYLSETHNHTTIGVTDEELEMIETVACDTLVHKFVSNDDLTCNDKGKHSAGMLSNEIVRSFHEIVEGKREPTFHSYSAHDTSIVALAASMGIRLDSIPKFLSYFLFELYRDTSTGDYSVKVFFNHDPVTYPACTLKPKYWEASDHYQPLSQLSTGTWSYQEFKDRFSSNDYLVFCDALSNMHFVTNGDVIGDHTEEVIAKCSEMFDYYDRDSNGTIDMVELEELFTRMGSTLTPSIIERFDHDGDGVVSRQEFVNTLASIIDY